MIWQLERALGPAADWLARQEDNNKLNTSLESVQHLWVATGGLGLGPLGASTYLLLL